MNSKSFSAPRPPGPGECCGSGCSNCVRTIKQFVSSQLRTDVWDVYRSRLEAFEQEQKLDGNLDPDHVRNENAETAISSGSSYWSCLWSSVEVYTVSHVPPDSALNLEGKNLHSHSNPYSSSIDVPSFCCCLATESSQFRFVPVERFAMTLPDLSIPMQSWSDISAHDQLLFRLCVDVDRTPLDHSSVGDCLSIACPINHQIVLDFLNRLNLLSQKKDETFNHLDFRRYRMVVRKKREENGCKIRDEDEKVQVSFGNLVASSSSNPHSYSPNTPSKSSPLPSWCKRTLDIYTQRWPVEGVSLLDIFRSMLDIFAPSEGIVQYVAQFASRPEDRLRAEELILSRQVYNISVYSLVSSIFPDFVPSIPLHVWFISLAPLRPRVFSISSSHIPFPFSSRKDGREGTSESAPRSPSTSSSSQHSHLLEFVVKSSPSRLEPNNFSGVVSSFLLEAAQQCIPWSVVNGFRQRQIMEMAVLKEYLETLHVQDHTSSRKQCDSQLSSSPSNALVFPILVADKHSFFQSPLKILCGPRSFPSGQECLLELNVPPDLTKPVVLISAGVGFSSLAAIVRHRWNMHAIRVQRNPNKLPLGSIFLGRCLIFCGVRSYSTNSVVSCFAEDIFFWLQTRAVEYMEWAVSTSNSDDSPAFSPRSTSSNCVSTSNSTSNSRSNSLFPLHQISSEFSPYIKAGRYSVSFQNRVDRLLPSRANLLKEALIDEGGYCLVCCTKENMDESVRNGLTLGLLKSGAFESESGAKKYLELMKKQGRFIMENWWSSSDPRKRA